MKNKQPVRTFIIQNKQTKQQWKARSGKVVWKTKAAAKNAFAYNYERCYLQDLPSELQPYFKENKYHGVGTLYFDEQDTYEIVELKSETMIAVENIAGVFKEIQSNDFVLTEEHKEFISNFISNFGG